jgi:hypothetical protein
MIDRYTIKFGPAVSQKELEKALHEPGLENDEVTNRVHKMKARIEILCDFQDIKKLSELLKQLSEQ